MKQSIAKYRILRDGVFLGQPQKSYVVLQSMHLGNVFLKRSFRGSRTLLIIRAVQML